MAHAPLQSASASSCCPLTALPDELLGIVQSHLAFTDLLDLSLTCGALFDGLTPSTAAHCVPMAYSPESTPQDHGAGLNLLLMPSDADAAAAYTAIASSWRLQLWLQSTLHAVLRSAEQDELRAEAGHATFHSVTSAPSVASSVMASSDWAHRSGIVIPNYQQRKANETEQTKRPSVHTVHMAALLRFALHQLPSTTPVDESPLLLSFMSPSIQCRLDRPHMLEAFLRQLLDIYDRHLAAVKQQKQQDERARQGDGHYQDYSSDAIHSQPEATPNAESGLNDEPMEEQSNPREPAPARRIPEAYLYDSPSLSFVVPSVSLLALERIVALLSCNKAIGDVRLQALGLRALGVLSICDSNRQVMVQLGAVRHALFMLRFWCNDPILVMNGAWSLVIYARPLGTEEGNTFYHLINRSAHAIDTIIDLHNPAENGPALIARLMRIHADRPDVLAKLSWSLINLSITEENKLALAQFGLVKLVCTQLRRYVTTHHELAFRSVSCLVNLVSRGEVQQRLAASDILALLTLAMRTYPYHWALQRFAVVLVRGLCFAGFDVRAEPGLMYALLRLYLNCMTESLHPNPDVREVILLIVEHLGSDIQREIETHNMHADIAADGTQLGLLLPRTAPVDPNASQSEQPAAPTVVEISPAALSLDRIAVSFSSSQRRVRAIVGWHRADRAAALAAASSSTSTSTEREAEDDFDRQIHPMSVALFGEPLSRALFHQHMMALEALERDMQQPMPAAAEEEEEEEEDEAAEMDTDQAAQATAAN